MHFSVCVLFACKFSNCLANRRLPTQDSLKIDQAVVFKHLGNIRPVQSSFIPPPLVTALIPLPTLRFFNLQNIPRSCHFFGTEASQQCSGKPQIVTPLSGEGRPQSVEKLLNLSKLVQSMYAAGYSP